MTFRTTWHRCVLSLICVIALSSCVNETEESLADDSDGAALGNRSSASLPQSFDRNCAWPTPPDTLFQKNGAILKAWVLSSDPIYQQQSLPYDSILIAYRKAIREAGADVRQPSLQLPDSIPPEAAQIWRAESYNNELVYSGTVGTITPIRCLDALLFAEQNRRAPQLKHSSEFSASVLRSNERDRLVVVFGAGNEMFPPKSVYGFDVVEAYVAEGWAFWYMLHNHTLQYGGEQTRLGVPVPSTSDIRLARALAEALELESVRVTNGFYTFIADVGELSKFRAR